MIFRAVSVFSITVFGLCMAQNFDIPMPNCKRDSKDYNSCLKRTLDDVWPLLSKDPPTGFPRLDPYNYGYEKAVLDTSVLYGEIIFLNMTIEGMGASRFLALRTHFISNDTFRLEIDSHVPKIFFYSDCDAYGNLGGFKLGGKGFSTITVKGIRTTTDISGHVKNDKWIIEHVRIFPMIRSFKLYLENFFDGNRQMNDFVTKFVNENWPPFVRSITPIAVNYWDRHISNLLTRIFSRLSFSKVFP